MKFGQKAGRRFEILIETSEAKLGFEARCISANFLRLVGSKPDTIDTLSTKGIPLARRSTPEPPAPAVLSVDEMHLGVERLNRRIDELDKFDVTSAKKRWDSSVLAVQTSIEETLARVFGHNTIEYKRYSRAAKLDQGPLVITGEPDSIFETHEWLREGKESSLAMLRQAVKGLKEEIADRAEAPEVEKSFAGTFKAKKPQRVFIVHGHDGESKETVARFISQLSLIPVILHELPNKGRTIITKFREEAKDIGFAVVLMTPDDHGSKSGEELRPRPRQNVVFELGYFIGELGPEKVAALIKGNVEKPSDFEGVVYITMDSGHWKIDLAKELKAAGFDIDFNKIMGL